MLITLTRLFPLWALLLSVLAYYTPHHFHPDRPWVTTLLMLIMFGMGYLKQRISNASSSGASRCRDISAPIW